MKPIVGVLDIPDLVVFILYFLITLGVGIWSSCQNRGSVGGYFLAGRSMHFILVGASLFASNIGSGHFVGLAGSGAASGIAISVFELNAIFILMILGWIFLPVYISSGVFTMPEYLMKRFGGQRIRIYLAVLALLLSIFTKISADLYAGAIFIEQSMEISLYPAVIMLLLVAALFSVLGGLTAVIWTDFAQTIIMLIGAFYLMIMCFIKVGGYEQLIEKYYAASPSSSRYFNSTSSVPGVITDKFYKCGIPPANAMHLMRSADDGSLPWPGVIVGLTISSVWYWCTDQVIVQRCLAAKNLSHAKAGTVMAGWLKILPMWLLVFPGMVARILYADEVACASPAACMAVCGKERGCTDIAYPKLVLTLMPSGAKGLMLAVMVASLISSLTSIFNSSSTVFTIDIYKRIRPKAKDGELLIVGRVFVLFMVGVGVAWIPIVKSGGELFHYIQSVTSYLAPPVCAVYVMAVLWKRCNEKGAFACLMSGLIVGMTRFIWEIIYPRVACGEEDQDKRPDILSKVHYLHFGILLFFISGAVGVIVSIVTKPLPENQLVRLLFWNRFSTGDRYEDGVLASRTKVGVANAGYQDTPDDVQKRRPSRCDLPKVVVDETEDEVEPPCWRKAFNWICGIEKQPKIPELSQAERLAMEAIQNNIDEVPLLRRVVNTMAIMLLTVTVFFWGFYA